MRKEIICCDRCGAEIPGAGARSIRIYTAGKKNASKEYDFCQDCLDAILEWIGSEVGCGEREEGNAVPRRLRLTDELRQKARDLKAEGKTTQEIDDELGLTFNQAKNLVYAATREN